MHDLPAVDEFDPYDLWAILPLAVAIIGFLWIMFFADFSAHARQCFTIDTVRPDGRTFTQCTVCCDDRGNCTRICV